jgi:hypothetical protein
VSVVQIVSASVGLSLILLLLGLVFWRRNLTAAEYTFARIILALAAACLAVLISGFLTINLKDVIQGSTGFAVFIIVFLYAPAGLQGTSEWSDLRVLWRNLRDIADEAADANKDDVVKALNALDETAAISDANSLLLKAFSRDYGESFCQLYRKLITGGYQIQEDGKQAGNLITTRTKSLAKKLECIE